MVVSPDHQEPLDPSKLWQATVDRSRDLRAVIDHMTTGGDAVSAPVDADRIAAAGHSYGGYASQVMGGARLDTQSLRTACVDARRADDAGVFLCDALEPHLADMADRAALTPLLEGLWPDWSGDRVDAVVSMAGDAMMFGPAGLRSLNVPVGAEHFAFTGPCASVRRVMTVVPFGFCDDPAWNRASARDVVAHHATAFLRAELKAKDSAAALRVIPGAGDDLEVRTRGYP